MSNFYHDGSYSPAAEAVLDPPISGDVVSSPRTIEDEQTISRPQKASYALFHYALLVYIFLFCTRLPELFPSIRLALGMTVVMLAGLLATGRGGDLFSAKLGRILTAFAVWTAICVPFSVWVGGSADVLKGVIQSVLFVAFILAFAKTLPEIKNCMYALAAAMGTVAVLSLTMFGTSAEEATTGLAAYGVAAPPTPAEAEQRLGLFHSATLQDPNFMSLYLLIGLPFLWLGAKNGGWFTRLLFFVLIPASLVAIGHSASRMALVMFVIGLFLFLRTSSGKERALVLTGTIAVTFLTVPFLPSSVTNRFMTLFHPKADTFESKEAADSAQVRVELLLRSLQLTALHPLFGVGPGQFSVADDLLAKQEGHTRGIWYYTHNAYTQTSSEAGIPALVLYLMAIVTSFRGLGDIRKRGPTLEVREMAKALQLSMWMVILGGLFLTTGFGGVPFVIMAFAVAFKMAVAKETRKSHSLAAA